MDLPANIRPDLPLSSEDVVGPSHLNVCEQLLALLEGITVLISVEEGEGAGVLRHYGRHLLQSGLGSDRHQDLLPVLGQVLDVHTVLAASGGQEGEPARGRESFLELEGRLRHCPGLMEHGAPEISPP